MTGKLLISAALGASLLLFGSGAFAADPQPQYTVQDVAKSFTGAAPAGDQAADEGPAPPKGACEAKGKVTGPDGFCYPNNAATAGFNLGRRATTKSAPAASASASSSAATTASATPARRQRRSQGVQEARANLQKDLQITFKLGSAELTDQGRVNAQVFAQALKTVPELADAKFRLDGYTDSTGHTDKNVDLSQRRAEAVKALLVSLGVDGSRLSAKGYGASEFLPGLPSTSPQNRRVVAVKE